MLTVVIRFHCLGNPEYLLNCLLSLLDNKFSGLIVEYLVLSSNVKDLLLPPDVNSKISHYNIETKLADSRSLLLSESLRIAKHDWIYFLDYDDTYIGGNELRQNLSKCINGNKSFILFDSKIGKYEETSSGTRLLYSASNSKEKAKGLEEIISKNIIHLGSFIFNKTKFIFKFDYNLRYREDYYLLLQILFQTSARDRVKVDTPILLYWQKRFVNHASLYSDNFELSEKLITQLIRTQTRHKG
jgi:hypothetical protein